MMLNMAPPYAHDGQIELIERLLAEHAWELAPCEIPALVERTAAIEMGLHVLARPDMRRGYITAGVLKLDTTRGQQLNQVLTFVAASPMGGAARARVVWSPLGVSEAFSMIRWLLTTPRRGGVDLPE